MGRRKKQDKWDAADKLNVGKEYLTSHISFVKLGRKYKLNESSIRKWVAKYKTQAPSTVLQWVNMYNNHEELTDSRPEGVYRMVKYDPVRKTSLEERLSIIAHCIEHDDNYSLTTVLMSPSRILYDRRGHKKAEEELVKALEECIGYYTNRRVQRKLDLLTLVEYHERMKAAA